MASEVSAALLTLRDFCIVQDWLILAAFGVLTAGLTSTIGLVACILPLRRECRRLKDSVAEQAPRVEEECRARFRKEVQLTEALQDEAAAAARHLRGERDVLAGRLVELEASRRELDSVRALFGKMPQLEESDDSGKVADARDFRIPQRIKCLFGQLEKLPVLQARALAADKAEKQLLDLQNAPDSGELEAEAEGAGLDVDRPSGHLETKQVEMTTAADRCRDLSARLEQECQYTEELSVTITRLEEDVRMKNDQLQAYEKIDGSGVQMATIQTESLPGECLSEPMEEPISEGHSSPTNYADAPSLLDYLPLDKSRPCVEQPLAVEVDDNLQVCVEHQLNVERDASTTMNDLSAIIEWCDKETTSPFPPVLHTGVPRSALKGSRSAVVGPKRTVSWTPSAPVVVEFMVEPASECKEHHRSPNRLKVARSPVDANKQKERRAALRPAMNAVGNQGSTNWLSSLRGGLYK